MRTVQDIRKLSNDELNQLVADTRLYFQNLSNEADGVPKITNKINAEYSTDFVAMYEVEGILGIGGQEDYMKMLAKMQSQGRGCMWNVRHATARQLAEAFVMLREYLQICRKENCPSHINYANRCLNCDPFNLLGCL